MTQMELAKAAGISQSTLTDAERTAQGSTHVTALARALKVRAEWLADGEGTMVAIQGTSRPAGSFELDTSKVRLVYVVGKGSGGLPERIWTDGDYPEGVTDSCADIATTDPHAFLVEVDGASMVPRYNPGEFALVEPSIEPELEDDVLVRLETGETMIKRLLSRRAGWRFGSFNTTEVLHYGANDVTWVYYVAHPVPRRKIKSRC